MSTTSKMFKASLGGGLSLLLGFTLAGPAAAQSWTELTPSDGPPEARNAHSAVYNPTTNQMIVFGGSNGLENDVWRLTDANGVGAPTWIDEDPEDPSGAGQDPGASKTELRVPNLRVQAATKAPPCTGGAYA